MRIATLVVLGGLFLVPFAIPATAAEVRGADARPASGGRVLRILSFNVEHLMSATRFAQWRAFCEPLGWREPAAGNRPERLTYCNALDGTDGRGRRLFAPVRDPAGLRQKRDLIAALIRAADADIVLLQEVSDAQAAADVLGPAYRVATTDERWRSHAIAQNLAIGWRSTLPGTVPELTVVEAISQAGADGRRTRPGLAITVDVGADRRLSIINLHLKAGCRQGRLDEIVSRKPDRAFRRESDCAVLQKQVPALEQWVDASLAAGHGVIVAGDFNRDLLREIRDRLPARSDGSDPTAPVDPSRIASLLAEISDEAPPAAWFALIRGGRYAKEADCHRHIDNFLLSRNLEPWLGRPLRQLSVSVIPLTEPVTPDRVRPSDHCPHLIELPLRAAN